MTKNHEILDLEKFLEIICSSSSDDQDTPIFAVVVKMQHKFKYKRT